jgi:hypothetical protein
MKKIFFFILFFFFFLSLRVEAATLSVAWPQEPLAPESTLSVSIFLETDKPINALEGDLLLKGATLEGIEEAGSALVFWVKKPTVTGNTLSFSGVTPGGIPIGKRFLFKVKIKTTSPGTASFSGDHLQALLNDGLGSAETLSIKENKVSVEKGSMEIPAVEIKDSMPPETFSIVESRSKDLADGKWFISFTTVDKETGIARYKVQESVIPPYFWFLFSPEEHDAESPYVLTGGGTTRYIAVSAVDLSGNTTESFLSPQVPLFWYLSIGVLVMMGVLFYRVRRRKR